MKIRDTRGAGFWDRQSMPTLVYSDFSTPVPSLTSMASCVRTITSVVDGDSCTLSFKVDEITKNHRSRSFSIRIEVGDAFVLSDAFIVKTKRTKRKRITHAESKRIGFKTRVHAIIDRLEWRVSGYASLCEGYVDYSCPLYACVICNASEDGGHTPDCLIRQLRGR